MKVGFYVCLFLFFCHCLLGKVRFKIIEQGSFAFSLPVQLTHAGDLKTSQILENTQQKRCEWGERRHNHHAVWEDTFDT